ncbi:deoxyribodipyrimidine photo-lyase [Dongia sp.]|uniref:cryptochrome/photolyase family protein n=1 Tax=Dongia sp. TaxID=1977262 RepID=UPI0035B39AA9
MPKSTAPTLLWLRRDLRLHDNPALGAAIAAGSPVIPIYIDDEPKLGGAARWWRGRSLEALGRSLQRIGSRLILRQGPALPALTDLVRETGAVRLSFNRRFEPRGLNADAEIVTHFRSVGLEVIESNGNRLHEPWALKTLKGDPFRVFTPFWRRLAESYRPPQPVATPSKLPAPATWPSSADLTDFAVAATWAAGMNDNWKPGEASALVRLDALPQKVATYAAQRDLPGIDGTSRLSPHLAWGEISVHEIWRRLGGSDTAQNAFLRELGWRDFNSHLLYHYPRLPVDNWNRQFDGFPFQNPGADFTAWCRGQTGFPIVDAGMRELFATGWMHNRVRMITASFLIKDLLIDWREGEKWFWDTLVDADLAQNAGNWQWVAGCGADAAPYFRIFNPTTQSEKFDPQGTYVRKWLPELAQLPSTLIHAPATAPSTELSKAGIILGKTYPLPIVDHAKARARALALYKTLGGGQTGDAGTGNLFP